MSGIDLWIPVRQDGKFLLEYDPQNGRVRLRRWGKEFVIELQNVTGNITSDKDKARKGDCGG